MLLGSCAAPPRVAPPPASKPMTSVSGHWIWAQRSIHPISGDLLVQEEQWRLEQAGDAVHGHYDRTVTRTSQDGRPYRCNSDLSFVRRTRYEVRGTVQDDRIEIEEVDYMADTGPCDDGVRSLDRYVGSIGENAIVLGWGRGRQTLQRARAMPPREPMVDLSGEWVWEHRTVDGDGDRKVERETWFLEQSEGELIGHYESIVTLTSGGPGQFECSQSPEYTMRARFEVVGRLQEGNRVLLREVSYEVAPGPCDGGRRRLASYRGSFTPESIVLDWGAGRQTLRRQ